MAEKPRHRFGYTPEETEIVRSACLTVAVTLGAHLEDLVIIGGLVPTLLIDSRRATPLATTDEVDLHPGTNDLDLGLSLAVLAEERYALISERLRAEGFAPDVNASGRPTVQRWTRNGLKVDFLIPQPTWGTSGRIQNLESDFGAIVTPGLELAFEERVEVELQGETLAGELVTRIVPVCGPGAFVVLKALAFGDRCEPKDAFDLVYVIRGSGGGRIVAEAIRRHVGGHPEIVRQAMRLLERDFQSPEHVGPLRFATFEHLAVEDQDAAAADAHGYVDDLLACLRDILVSGDDAPTTKAN